MRKDIQDIYPLSPIQHGILFHSLHSPEMGLYHMQDVFTFNSNLNLLAFEEAWQQLSALHSVLRTSFYWEELDKPLQVVHEQVTLPVKYEDWRTRSSSQHQDRLKTFLKQDRLQGFDFSKAPLIRVALIQIEDNTYFLVLIWHLIIVDGWSLPLLFTDWVKLYEACCKNQNELTISGSCFGDYIDWLQKQDSSKAEKFWHQQLSGVTHPTPITNLESNNLSNVEERYEDLQISLLETTTKHLKLLAKKYRLTMSTFLQGAWAILLSYYSGQNDLVYGCTFSGRPVDLKNSESMIGEMVNTLPIRLQLNLDENLLPWLQQLQTKLVEIREYEYSSLVDVQKCSEVPVNIPLFESFVVFENQKTGKFLEEWGSLKISEHIGFYKTNYPLTIVGYPGSELTIGINYDFYRFDTATIANILEHFKTLLEGIAANPQTTLRELLLLIKVKPHSKLLDLEREMSLNLEALAIE